MDQKSSNSVFDLFFSFNSNLIQVGKVSIFFSVKITRNYFRFHHSWAPLTENLAGEKHLSLIANTSLAQLNGETLKSKSAKFYVRYKKHVFQSAKNAKSASTAKLPKSANSLL